MISKKHSIIIKYLTEKSEYVTAGELSQQIDVSVRTVKRYIKDLNYYLNKYSVEITSVKGIGYKLEGPAKEIKRVLEEAKRFIEDIQTDDSVEGRITKALCIFLNNEYVSAEALSEKMNLSLPSTNKLVSNVKDILISYELKLVSKPHHGSKIVGEEIKIRSLILDYAIKTNENDFIEVRLENISREEIEHIERVATEILKDSNIIVSDKDFNELLTRIIVSISRIRSRQALEQNAFKDSYIVDSYGLIKRIMRQIAEQLNMNIEEIEIQYVFSSSGIIAYNYNTGKSLFNDSEDKINRFVDEMLQELSLITEVDFRKDADFVNALIMHLKIFINRFSAGVKANNPLLGQIKSKFPMETNLATIAAKKLEEEFNVSLDEDEIGFIAMHFGAAFERARDKGGRKVCIICHYGIGTSRLLAEKIKRRISDITIVGTYPVRYLDVALEQDIDFIVSTVKLDVKDLKIPVLYIENVFSDEIINELNQIFSEKDQRKNILRDTFNKEAFFRIHADTREEAIRNLGIEMKVKKFIDDDVIAKVFERENMSSTDIGHLVAIPHTILDGRYKSIIGVGILDKPIIWNKQEVQLIFMVCFNRKESYNFPVFKYLYNFIEDEGNIKRALKALSFEKFMEILDEK
jgi:lichenan operon transcriptional antiterminator